MDDIFLVFVIPIIVFYSLLFTIIVRRMLINSRKQNNNLIDLNKKLDKIIELLENKSS